MIAGEFSSRIDLIAEGSFLLACDTDVIVTAVIKVDYRPPGSTLESIVGNVIITSFPLLVYYVPTENYAYSELCAEGSGGNFQTRNGSSRFATSAVV